MPITNTKSTLKTAAAKAKAKDRKTGLGKRRASADPESSEEDEDSDSIDEDQEDAEMDSVEYHKFLSKMFPSKHSIAKAMTAPVDMESSTY